MSRRRLSWDECWMGVALWVAQRSSCTLFQAGAVIVDADNRVRATGYNGPPRDMASGRLGRTATCEDDCPRGRHEVERGAGYGFSCISVHAEVNALLFADRAAIDGGTMYVNGISCQDCAKVIANCGVHRVVELDDQSPHRSAAEIRSFFARCNVQYDIVPYPSL